MLRRFESQRVISLACLLSLVASLMPGVPASAAPVPQPGRDEVEDKPVARTLSAKREAPAAQLLAGPLRVEAAPPGTESNPPLANGGLGGFSVVTSTGSFTTTIVDAALPGLGPAPALTRTYNSNDTRIGPFGAGWTHSYAMRVTDPGDGTGAVILTVAEGKADRYALSGGAFVAPPGVRTALVRNADSSFTATATDQSVATFDTSGRLVRLADRFGNASVLIYNPSGQLTTVSDPSGRGSLSLAYDATSGRLVSVNDWLSPARSVRYAYDLNARLASVTDRAGGVTTFGYDAGDRLATIRDALSHTTLTNMYDAQGRVSSQTDATSAQTTFTYITNPDGTTTTTVTHPSSSFDGFNATIADTFDIHRWLKMRQAKPTAAEISVLQYTYDPNGNPTMVTDARGNATQLCYDVDFSGTPIPGSLGNLTRIIAPPPAAGANPLVTLLAYDAKNNLTGEVAPKGVANGAVVDCTTNLSASVNSLFSTDLSYDPSQTKLLQVTRRFVDPDLAGTQTATTKLEYADAANPGRATRVIPPRGNTGVTPDYTYASSFAYTNGLITSAIDPLGNRTTYGYDVVGRRTSVVDANGNAAGASPAAFTTRFSYDNEDRLRFVKLPPPVVGGGQLVAETRYDAFGNPVVRLDPNGQVTKFLYDVRNQLAEVQESPSAWSDPVLTPAPLYRTTYAYDNLGRLRRVLRAAGTSDERATDYAYDGLGGIRSETQYPSWPATASTLLTRYTYDSNRNLAALVDPLGQTTNYGYDALDRLSAIAYSDGTTPNVSYAYDANGNPITMTDGTGTTTFGYDERNLMLSVTSGGRTIGYRHDLDGSRRRLIYTDGFSVTYSFDKARRVSSLTDSAGRTTSYTHNPNRTKQGLTAVNGTTATFAYDNARRRTQVRHNVGSDTVNQHGYQLDAASQRTGVAEVLSQVGASVPSAWGANTVGQVGDGTTVSPRNPPVAVTDFGTPIALAAGTNHSLAVAADATVWGWGSNFYGQVGDGTSGSPSVRPTPVHVVGGATGSVLLQGITGVAGGSSHSLALRNDGSVWAWGYNVDGETGDGTGGTPSSPRPTPVQVRGGASGSATLQNIVQIGAGGFTSYALRNDGTVWAWGYNLSGETGDGTSGSKNSPRLTPVQVKKSDGTALGGITSVSAGRSHVLALAADGAVWAWGFNRNGELGQGDIVSPRASAVRVKSADGVTPLSGVKAVAAGNGISFALMSDGTVRAWGYNSYGDLGDGTTTSPRTLPVTTSGLSTATAIEAGGDHGLALLADGTVRAWGRNDSGQLGASTTMTCPFQNTACSTVPVQVRGITGVTRFATESNHSLSAGAVTQGLAYAYDGMRRLVVDGTTSYAYDPVGNRTSMTKSGVTTAYTYDKADRITAAGGTGYSVNANGNLVSRGADSFTYDQANRLTSASVGGTMTTYRYDGTGKRVSKTTGPNTTAYVHDAGVRLPLVLEDGSRKYVWGLGLAYAVDAAGAGTAYHADALGSVREITDASGTTIQSYRRDAFGNSTVTQGSSSQPFGFTGEPTDVETGFVYLRARMYDPASGRFVQRDDFGGRGESPFSLNRYAYANNSPTTMRDPSGHCGVFITVCLGALVGALSYTATLAIINIRNRESIGTGFSWSSLGIAIAAGALSGAFLLPGAAATPLTLALANTQIAFGTSVATQLTTSGTTDTTTTVISTVVAAVASAALPAVAPTIESVICGSVAGGIVGVVDAGLQSTVESLEPDPCPCYLSPDGLFWSPDSPAPPMPSTAPLPLWDDPYGPSLTP